MEGSRISIVVLLACLLGTIVLVFMPNKTHNANNNNNNDNFLTVDSIRGRITGVTTTTTPTMLFSNPLMQKQNAEFHSNEEEKEDLSISVRFYGESQCPFCRKFVVEAWEPIWMDPEFRQVLDYDFIAWGNAYFATPDCGSGPRYSSTERHCWAQKCIAVATDDDDDACFSGPAIYQHSEKEGQVDIYETCVKQLLGLEVAVEFTYCCEGDNMEDETLPTAESLMRWCLTGDEKIVEMVQTCYEQQGKEIEIANAKQTPPHPGVPYVVVDGMPLDNPMDIQNVLCSTIRTKNPKAKLPKACEHWEIQNVYKSTLLTRMG